MKRIVDIDYISQIAFPDLCLWCGKSFDLRQTGGHPQKFCCRKHKETYHASKKRKRKQDAISHLKRALEILEGEKK